MNFATNTITEITRKNIIDDISLNNFSWSGNLNDIEFLGRLYDLQTLPSTDRRFGDAAGDSWQHRINNDDWDNDWIFYDSRFNLFSGPDENFLKFLSHMLHPIVQRDPANVQRLLQMFNGHLTTDGWELGTTDFRVFGNNHQANGISN